jgi:hypothetical protein
MSEWPLFLWNESSRAVLNSNGVSFPQMFSSSCRARATECIEAAGAIASPERKIVFLELAQRWLDLGSNLDAIGLRGNVLLYRRPRPIDR